jgi:predicted glycosyltransferase
MRALGCSLNGRGLGHVSRMTSILRALRDRDGSAQVLHATSSDALYVSHAFDVPTLRLNSYEDLLAFQEFNEPSSKELDPQLTYLQALRSANRAVWRDAVRLFDPDVTLIDAFPLGPLDSVLPGDGGRAASFLIQGSFQSDGYAAQLAEAAGSFRWVVTPWPEVLRDVYPGVVFADAFWSGFITLRPDVVLRRSEARTSLGLAEGERACLINVGGGSSSWSESLTDGAVAAAIDLGFTPFVLAPPLAEQRRGAAATLPRGVAHESVRRVSLWPTSAHMSAFDLAVSTVGMNSLPELVRSRVPCCFVAPADEWSGDQSNLMQVVDALGLGSTTGATERRELVVSLEKALCLVPRDGGVQSAFDVAGEDRLADFVCGALES